MGDRKKSAPGKGPRNPVQTRSIRTREKLMNSGEKLFIKRGFHNLLSDNIAREAGVSVGSFYAYFKDKRDIFIAVLQRASARLMEKAGEGLSALASGEGRDAEGSIRNIIVTLIGAHRTSLPLFEQAGQLAAFDERVMRYLREADRASMEMFQKMIRRFRPKAQEKEIAAAAYVIFNASEGIVHAMVHDEGIIERENALDQTARLFGCYLRASRGD